MMYLKREWVVYDAYVYNSMSMKRIMNGKLKTEG